MVHVDNSDYQLTWGARNCTICVNNGNCIFCKSILFTSSLLQSGRRRVADDDRDAYRGRHVSVQGTNDGNLTGGAINGEEILFGEQVQFTNFDLLEKNKKIKKDRTIFETRKKFQIKYIFSRTLKDLLSFTR